MPYTQLACHDVLTYSVGAPYILTSSCDYTPPGKHCCSLGGPGRDTKQMSASQEHHILAPCLGFASTILNRTSEKNNNINYKVHCITSMLSTWQTYRHKKAKENFMFLTICVTQKACRKL